MTSTAIIPLTQWYHSWGSSKLTTPTIPHEEQSVCSWAFLLVAKEWAQKVIHSKDKKEKKEKKEEKNKDKKEKAAVVFGEL